MRSNTLGTMSVPQSQRVIRTSQTTSTTILDEMPFCDARIECIKSGVICVVLILGLMLLVSWFILKLDR